jgi:hypothetical protein
MLFIYPGGPDSGRALFVLLQTTPRGPWLAAHVRTLALKNGKVMRLLKLSEYAHHGLYQIATYVD